MTMAKVLMTLVALFFISLAVVTAVEKIARSLVPTAIETRIDRKKWK